MFDGLMNIIQKGGYLMAPIIICSIVAIGVIIERFVRLRKSEVDADKFMDEIRLILDVNDIKGAIAQCKSTPGPIANICRMGLMKYDRNKQEIREAIEDAAALEIPQLEKRLGILATVAHASPLLGLLGTVTGMISTFQVIAEASQQGQPVDQGLLAAGIWVALITTAAGLTVAIPTYIAHNYLAARTETLVNDMERSATDLLNIMLDKRMASED